MNTKQLQKIISQGENETVEFKSSFNANTIESIVAFSNAYGGKILIGVLDNGEINGVELKAETLQNWQNEIKQKTEPAMVPIINAESINGKIIVWIIVNEFPVKPVSSKGRYYVRKNNANHRLTIDEIIELRMLSLNYSFDAFYVNTSFEDLNVQALEFFRNKVKNSGRFNLDDDLQYDFEKLGLIKEGKLTRACELLFGIHHANIHLGRFKSETTIIDDLMIRSPLVLAVEEALDFIKKNIRLGFEFGGDDLQRKEKWQYPIPVIRELLLNAIVHRDYSKPTDVIVKIFDDSIQIINPGNLMGDLSVEVLQEDYYQSIHRNKLLAEAFYLMGDIEKYGTGFKRIRDWLKEYKNVSFNINDLNYLIQLDIFELKTDKVTDKVTDNQRKISLLLKDNNQLTTNQLAIEIGISQRKIKENIKKLREINLIKRIGPAKGGHWKIIE